MSERAARAWTTSYRAGWVLPISAPPIAGGAVVIEGGRIVWVGRAGDEPSLSRARVVELGNSVVAPGFVNAHTHLDLTVLQGLCDGLPFFDWIRAVVACRDELTDDELRDSARLGVIRGLEAGITTFADTAPVAASFDAMLEFGVRGIAYQELFGPDPAGTQSALAALAERVAAMRARATPLVRVGVSPHAPYSVSDDLYTAAAAFARREGVPMATHLAESDAETALVVRGEGPFAGFLGSRGISAAPRAVSPVALLARLGALGPDMLLIHCVQCDQSDVDTIARSGATVVTCPRSNDYFAHGRAPARAFLDAGVRLGVGSDSMASNASMDPLAEASATFVADGAAQIADHWRLATIGGAEALGLDSRIGTLEVGKDADLSVFPIDGGGASDGYSAVTAGTRASHVIVAGVERLRAARVGGNADGVAKRAKAAAQRLREWRARAAPS